MIISSEAHDIAQSTNERKSLLQRADSRRRIFYSSKCISSKAAIVVMVCSFSVSVLYMFLLDQDSYDGITLKLEEWRYYNIASNGIFAFLCIFFPLAGHLADVKFGRYKTVFESLKILLFGLVMSCFGMIILFVSRELHSNAQLVVSIIAYLLLTTSTLLGVIGFIGFSSTVIQFGLDQLHESPSDHQSLFIHWLMWSFFSAHLLVALVNSTFVIEKSKVLSLSILGIVFVSVVIVLFLMSCIAHRKRSWFLIEPSRINPYNLVYYVTRYARQHKVPVNRSAFTYCEDEIPSGLDLGKSKYGGPFTIEQVEDVKAFYGVLKVLFSAASAFILYSAADPTISLYRDHITNQTVATGTLQVIKMVVLEDEVLYFTVIFLSIPVYILLLRPVFPLYIPGMLKRIGIGIILVVASLVCTFIVDTITHLKDKHLGCMFNADRNSTSSTLSEHDVNNLLDYLFLVQSIILALSKMFLLIGMVEFICSQTPHSMKGLIIGLHFALQGILRVFGLSLVIPFAIFWKAASFPSCGMYYYLGSVLWGIFSLSLYTCVSRRYKYRVRDEPCRVQHYVEEYYSKINQERSNEA